MFLSVSVSLDYMQARSGKGSRVCRESSIDIAWARSTAGGVYNTSRLFLIRVRCTLNAGRCVVLRGWLAISQTHVELTSGVGVARPFENGTDAGVEYW